MRPAAYISIFVILIAFYFDISLGFMITGFIMLLYALGKMMRGRIFDLEQDLVQMDILFLIGSILLLRSRNNWQVLISDTLKHVDFVSLFTLGSFALIMSTMIYAQKDHMRTPYILGLTSVMFFFLSGFLIFLVTVFNSSETTELFLTINLISLSVSFVAAINLLQAALYLFDNEVEVLDL